MHDKRIRTLAVATALGTALVLGPVLQARDAVAEEQINVRFSWKLKGEYAPFYVALDQGYYGAEGLSVALGEGAGAQAAIGGLLQGQEDLVVLPGAFALTAISQGMPIQLIALYHPAAPTVLITWPDNPVREPKDLEGKSVATAVGETGTTYLPVFCRRNNVDCDRIQMVQMAIQARVPQFIARQVDVVSVYESNDLPILEAMHDTEFVVFDLPAYGLEIPGMAVVASTEAIARRGDAFMAFLRATAKGVETAMADPTAAAGMMRNYWDTTLETEVIAKQIENTVVRIPSYEGKPYGWIDAAIIEDALGIMTEFGEIPEAKPLDTYYTNELLERFAS